ncbi:uncharacterized protein LOC114759404 [Neltuma alba]|uniref:uncharacterized protein LOC114759404 n=1 Tax=Neltuma alba TaxID=207710 RepID=UPI0010A4E2B2|nr:uncharacterized protein LOC114759404 [Prosopis alba]XP_028804410.1 uncharacterized protein LOC114759404 [Prosopis alba]
MQESSGVSEQPQKSPQDVCEDSNITRTTSLSLLEPAQGASSAPRETNTVKKGTKSFGLATSGSERITSSTMEQNKEAKPSSNDLGVSTQMFLHATMKNKGIRTCTNGVRLYMHGINLECQAPRTRESMRIASGRVLKTTNPISGSVSSKMDSASSLSSSVVSLLIGNNVKMPSGVNGSSIFHFVGGLQCEDRKQSSNDSGSQLVTCKRNFWINYPVSRTVQPAASTFPSYIGLQLACTLFKQ